MKLRNGFVSNSSTSSFIIIGYLLDQEKYKLGDVMEKIYPSAVLDKTSQERLHKNWSECNENEKEEIYLDVWIEGFSLRVYSGDDDGIPGGKFAVGFRYTIDEDDYEPTICSFDNELKILRDVEIDEDLVIIKGMRAS
jgi:hypothetical protein